MINVADSAFQHELVDAAKRAGKLPAGYEIAVDTRGNSPGKLEQLFARNDIKPYFPTYPLGTDLTPTEQHLADALEWMQARVARPLYYLGALATAAVRGGRSDHQDAMARMGLERPGGTRQRMLARILRHALDRTSL